MDRTETIIATANPVPTQSPYIDWAAVLGGAVVAAAIAGLCTAFGAALGLSTVSAERGEGSFNLWLVVTAVWIVLTLVLSFAAGGYVAGRMRRETAATSADERAARDGINGLVVWGLGMLMSAWMAASAISGAASAVGTAVSAAGSAVGGIAQGAGAAVGNAVQGVAQGIGAAVPDDAGEGLLDYVNGSLMRPVLQGVSDATTAQQPGIRPGAPSANNEELAQQTGLILGNIMRTGEISDRDRSFLTAAVAQRTGQSQAEVEAQVDEAIASVQEARAEAEQALAEAQAEAQRLAEEAEQAAIDAAETARKSAILTAFLLTAAAIVAGAAAVIGGVRGGTHRDEGQVWGGFTYRF